MGGVWSEKSPDAAGGSRRKDKRSVTDRSIEARPVETLMDATVMVQKLWYL